MFDEKLTVEFRFTLAEITPLDIVDLNSTRKASQEKIRSLTLCLPDICIDSLLSIDPSHSPSKALLLVRSLSFITIDEHPLISSAESRETVENRVT